jgi:hypothetical protein
MDSLLILHASSLLKNVFEAAATLTVIQRAAKELKISD